jgi:probable HAF family extracellular repeat protein
MRRLLLLAAFACLCGGLCCGVLVVSHAQAASGAFIWEAKHGMRDFAAPGGADTEAYAINFKGQVVGGGYGASGWHAFVWDAEHGMQDLGEGVAVDINSKGRVVGWSMQ